MKPHFQINHTAASYWYLTGPMDAAAIAQKIACEERARLIRVYSRAASDYNSAVQVLYLRSDVANKADYLKHCALSEMARRMAETAQKALDRNTLEHGC
jgi:hypothetical protein